MHKVLKENINNLNKEHFKIEMGSNTKDPTQYDFQFNIFKNEKWPINVNYYQIKLRNSTDLPNVTNLAEQWTKYLINPLNILVFDISFLPI